MTQAKGEKKNTAAVCAALAEPIARELGVYLWDVVFEKEGAGWYLRYFIDKESGVTIDECEAFSRAVSDLLDKADPIPQSYCLEVGSPGVERKLTKPWHFEKYAGADVLLRLVRPRTDGEREFVGALLKAGDEGVTLSYGEGESETFAPKDIAFVRLYEEL